MPRPSRRMRATRNVEDSAKVMPLGLAGAIRNPARAVLLFAAFAVAASLVMAGAIFSDATQAAFDTTYERQNGADISLWIGGTSCPAASSQAAHLPSAYSAEVRCSIPGATRLVLDQNSLRVSAQIRDEPERYWRLIPRSGETSSVALGEPGEPGIIIEERLARETGLKVGDSTRIRLGERQAELKIIGTASDPSKGPYPLFRPATVYVSSRTAEVLGVRPRPDRLLVKSSAPVNAASKQRVIDDAKASGFTVYEGVTTSEFRQLLGSLSTVIDKFVAGVAMLATIGAALLVAMLQQASVVEESREIAVLKAMGFTPANITMQMVIRALVIAMAGVTFGVLVGLATYRAISTWAADLVDGLSAGGFQMEWITRTGILVLAIAAVFSAYPALTAARVRTASALRKAPVLRNRRFTPPAPIMSRPIASIGVGFLTRRPTRAALAVLAVAATISVILGTTGAQAFSSNLSSEFSGDHFDLWVSGSGISDAGIRELMRTVPSVEAAAPRYSTPQVRDGAGHTYWFESFELSQDLHRPTVFEGRPVEGTGEIVMGPNAMSRLGAKVGDTVHLEIGGIPADLKVVGIIRGLRGLGDVGEIAVETLLGLGIQPRLSAYMVRVTPGADPEEVARSISTISGGSAEARSSRRDTASISGPLTIAMGASSLVVTGTGLLALVLIMLLTLREFAKEMTIMKTLGASTTTLLSGFALYGASLGLAAGLLALPLSRLLTNVVFGSIMTSLGISGSEIVGRAPHLLIISMTVIAGALLGAGMSIRLAISKPGLSLRED